MRSSSSYISNLLSESGVYEYGLVVLVTKRIFRYGAEQNSLTVLFTLLEAGWEI